MSESQTADNSIEVTLQQAAEGDDAAWRQLLERYAHRVFALLVHQCHDRELAEELTQATFVKLFDQLRREDGYQDRGRFEPWLFRVAMNHLRDEMRRRKRQAKPTDMTAAAMDHQDAGRTAPSAPIEQQEQVDQLRTAIAQMSEADQQVIHLRHTAGLAFAEIAQVLDQPLGTVLARAHRAMKKLREQLTEA